MNYPKLHTTDKAQELYTPPADAKKILHHIPISWTIYECCYGDGTMAGAFTDEGYSVVGEPDRDFLRDPIPPDEYDCIITNPPFRNHKDFVERAIGLQKPFAFLLRLEHLGGVRAFDLFGNLKIQIIIPRKRINYITERARRGEADRGSPFHSVWLTYRLSLVRDILYTDI